MSEVVGSKKYSVVVQGVMVDGFEIDQVKANLAKAFKLNEQQLGTLFSGKTVAIRRGVDKEQALKLHAGLKRAGIVAHVKLQQAQKAVSQPVTDKPAQSVDTNNSDSKEQTITCSRCGHEQTFSTTCESCKMDLRLLIQRLEKKRKIRDFLKQQSSALK